MSQAPSSFCQIALWSKSRSTLGRVWKRVTLSPRSRGTRAGVQNPASSGDAVSPQTESTAAAGGCARRSGCSRCRAVASLTHRRARKTRLRAPGRKPIPEGGFAVCTRGAHEEDGTCRPRRIWGCGGPQHPAPGQDPPPRAPLGSGTVKHLRIMNSQPHTAEAEAAILSGCLPDTRALGPQSWASGSSLRPCRPSVPRAGGFT